MAISRTVFAVPLLYQQLFYVPPPMPVPATPPAFVQAQTTTGQCFRRTLFYQANIVPPPTAAVQAQAAAATPDKWMQAWRGPSKYQPNRGPFASYVPAPPPAAVVDNINAATGITTSAFGARTLFYQANVSPIAAPAAADNTVTIDKWQQPFVASVQRRPTPPTEYALYLEIPPIQFTSGWYAPLSIAVKRVSPPPTDFVTYLEKPADVAPRGWYVPFSAAPARELSSRADQLAYAQPPPTVNNLTTTLEWLIKWDAPPRVVPPKILAQPFVPREAVLDNTVTPDNWLRPFDKAVQPQRPVHTQPVLGYAAAPQVTVDEWLVPLSRAGPVPKAVHTQPISGYQPVAVSNLTTTLEWQIAWQGPPRRLLPLPGGVTYVVQPSNLTTTLEWLTAWQGPPRYTLALPGGVTQVPQASNLTTTLEWMQAWQGPPRYRPVHTQPVLGLTPSNLTTTLEWLTRFDKAVPAAKPVHTQPFYGYPYASVSNLTTTLEWLQAWQGPPRYQPPKILAQPFVPREATIENTITGIAWLQPFYKAAPATKAIYTQPVFGYPYVSQSNLTTTLEWMQAFKGPPRYTPLRSYPYQPFVPREAVLENTVTPDKWLLGFQKAVATPPSRPTQPIYVVPPVSNLTTTLEWMQQWKGPPRYTPPKLLAQPFVPREATIDNTIFADKWLRPLGVKPAGPQRPWLTEQFARWTFKPAAVAPPFDYAATTTGQVFRRTLFYQAKIEPPLAKFPFGYTQDLFAEIHLTVDFHVCAWSEQAAAPGFCLTGFQADAFQTDAFQTICIEISESEVADAWVVEVEAAGFCQDAFQGDTFQANAFQTECLEDVAAEATDTWVEQAQSDDDYDEQEECGR